MNMEQEVRTAEAEHTKRDEELFVAITELGAQMDRRLRAIEIKVDPMHEMFSSVSGFNRISVWILKLLAAAGAALLGFYAIVEFVRNATRSQ